MVDIFRVANGKIAEHWDVMQEEVSAAQSANGNSMLPPPARFRFGSRPSRRVSSQSLTGTCNTRGKSRRG